MLKEFKDFIAKGNVMDMAVGIIIGAAFTAIVGSLVADMINPLIGLFMGGLIFQACPHPWATQRSHTVTSSWRSSIS